MKIITKKDQRKNAQNSDKYEYTFYQGNLEICNKIADQTYLCINFSANLNVVFFPPDWTRTEKSIDCCNRSSSTHLCFNYHTKTAPHDVS